LAEESCSALALPLWIPHIERDAPSSAGSNQSWWVNLGGGDSEILYGLRDRYEQHHKLKISGSVAAAKLSERYISDRYLPDKAIDLVDEAGSRG